MDHPYSFWADVLSKFQGAPPWIQALSLMLLVGVTVAVVWCVADVVKHSIGVVRRRKPNARLVYGVVQDADGRWLVCIEGEAEPVGTGAVEPIDVMREHGLTTAMLPRRL